MDALGIFELGAKAGRAYVRAIRQAYRDALGPLGDPESDYYASRLGVAEEGGEALDPWTATTPEEFDRVVDAHNAEVARILQKRCEEAELAETAPSRYYEKCCQHGCDCSDCYGTPAGYICECVTRKVPSSSAGRGVGSPGVSAGAEEPAPSGERPTPGEFAAVAVLNVLADHQFRADPGSDPDFDQAGCCTCSAAFPMDEYDWREHVAAEIQRRIDAAITTSQ